MDHCFHCCTVGNLTFLSDCLLLRLACRFLSANPNTPFSGIPDLPKAACQLLEEEFVVFTSAVEQCQTSADGTRKLLIRLQDRLRVEAVIMTYATPGQHLPPPASCLELLLSKKALHCSTPIATA